MIYIINNQPHPQGVFMIKNYKLILIGVLVSCSLSNAMEKATISVTQAEIERRKSEANKRATIRHAKIKTNADGEKSLHI